MIYPLNFALIGHSNRLFTKDEFFTEFKARIESGAHERANHLISIYSPSDIAENQDEAPASEAMSFQEGAEASYKSASKHLVLWRDSMGIQRRVQIVNEHIV